MILRSASRIGKRVSFLGVLAFHLVAGRHTG